MPKPVPKLPYRVHGLAWQPSRVLRTCLPAGVFLMCTRDPDICLPICPEAKWRLVT